MNKFVQVILITYLNQDYIKPHIFKIENRIIRHFKRQKNYLDLYFIAASSNALIIGNLSPVR